MMKKDLVFFSTTLTTDYPGVFFRDSNFLKSKTFKLDWGSRLSTLPREGERLSSVTWQYRKKKCTKTHIGFSCGTERELCWGNMIKVCCGVTLCNVTASHIQKQRTKTALYKTHHGGCFSSSGGEKIKKKEKNIDHLKATEYNLFVSYSFLGTSLEVLICCEMGLPVTE